jgi:hypothetical protein
MQELATSAGNRFQPTDLLRARAADGRSLCDDTDTSPGTTPT